MAPTIFFILSGYFLRMISLRTHKPEMPVHFCHLIFQLQVVCQSCSVILKFLNCPLYLQMQQSSTPGGVNSLIRFFVFFHSSKPSLEFNSLQNSSKLSFVMLMFSALTKISSDDQTSKLGISQFKLQITKIIITIHFIIYLFQYSQD